MNRTRGLILALAAATTLGACASSGSQAAATQTVTPTAAPADTGKSYPPGLAQPSENDFTKRAEILLVKAQASKDDAGRTADYQQAAQTAQQGLQQDSLNPKLWLQLGQAWAGAGDYQKADSAFSRAQTIYPAYEPDIESERESAWVNAFNGGVQAMQAQNDDEAIAQMEKANVIYDKRPEALLNLASLYIRNEETEKAADAYSKVLEIVNGPARQNLPAEVTADWDKYAEMARSNTAQLYAQAGVQSFRDEDYAAAATNFEKALKINPYYRDALHNLAQALYVETSGLEAKQDSVPAAQAKEIEAKLNELYPKFQKIAERVHDIDPYNANVDLLLARAYRGLGVLASDTAQQKQYQNKALAVLEESQKMPFEVTNLQVSLADSAVDLQGAIQNKNLAPGTPVTLKFSMLAEDGSVVGTKSVTVNAPEKDAATGFEVSVPVSKSVLGWKYERVSQ